MLNINLKWIKKQQQQQLWNLLMDLQKKQTLSPTKYPLPSLFSQSRFSKNSKYVGAVSP